LVLEILRETVFDSISIINDGSFQNKVSGITTPASNGKVNNIYGHMVVGEESEDSENSSVYHEPYKLLPSTKQEYGCLLKKDTLSSSKSGEYTGKWPTL
jgi:discoidin domain receptor family protein 2